jgi:putative membrane protein
MDLSRLPALNASLNLASAVLVTLGFVFIRQRAITAHTISMLGACLTSTLFLISYLAYHYFHGSTHFQGRGWLRAAYFTILISHTILAVVVLPMVLGTLWHAVRGRFLKHVAWARLTLPVWLYVSVTGVVVYWMLYRLHV